MNRQEMIKNCSYLDIFPSLRDDINTLRGKCAKARGLDEPDNEINNMNKEELVRCNVDKTFASL